MVGQALDPYLRSLCMTIRNEGTGRGRGREKKQQTHWTGRSLTDFQVEKQLKAERGNAARGRKRWKGDGGVGVQQQPSPIGQVPVCTHARCSRHLHSSPPSPSPPPSPNCKYRVRDTEGFCRLSNVKPRANTHPPPPNCPQLAQQPSPAQPR